MALGLIMPSAEQHCIKFLAREKVKQKKFFVGQMHSVGRYPVTYKFL
jgi:hypothetical protein